MAETQVDDRGFVAALDESRRDVLQAERLDAEEGSETEAFVARVGPQQQNVHVRAIVDFAAGMSAIEAPGNPPRTPATPAVPRARRKWVSHGLSNRIVYGGLHYGARWLPLPVLKAISTVGNSIAVTVLRTTLRGMADNFVSALEVPAREATRLARRVFFEYGRATVDVWRLRSEAFTPRITTFEEDARVLARSRRNGRGFLLVTGHVGNWEMGAVTLRRHDLTPAVVGQPELDPNVQDMRLDLRTRLGVESIDIGTSMATAFKVRSAVDRGRAVALLVDRAYPEDQVVVPFFGRPTAVPAVSRTSRAVLQLRRAARLLPAEPGRELPERLGRAARRGPDAVAGGGCPPDPVPRRGGPGTRGPREPDAVVQLLGYWGNSLMSSRGTK